VTGQFRFLPRAPGFYPKLNELQSACLFLRSHGRSSPISNRHQNENRQFFLEKLVGARGFEPSTPRSRTEPRTPESQNISHGSTFLANGRLTTPGGFRLPSRTLPMIRRREPDNLALPLRSPLPYAAIELILLAITPQIAVPKYRPPAALLPDPSPLETGVAMRPHRASAGTARKP
jgi:hypothetical protein